MKAALQAAIPMENAFNSTVKPEEYSNISAAYNVTRGGIQIQRGDMNKNGDMENDVVLWAIIDVFLFLAIMFGNILTIYAIIASKRVSMIISNRFILSLAISDLIVGFMVLYHMMFYIHPELGRYFEFCIVRLVLISLACTASVFNIFGIAIDRYIAIVFPLHYQKIMTKRSSRLISILGWILSFMIAMTPTFWNKWRDGTDSDSTCEMGHIVHPVYVMTMYAPVYLVLYTGMCTFYIQIINETRKHAKRMNHLTKDRQSPWKSIQVLTLVLGSFTISYTPFIIIVVINSIFQRKSKTISMIYKITYSLVVSNSAVNPIIYAWKNQELKKSFWNIIHCKSVNSSDEII